MRKPDVYTSDEALLKDLRAAAPAAFEAVYQRYYRIVAKQVSDAGLAGADAEDLFQEVLVVLVQKVRDPEFRLNAKMSTYLFAVARNLLLKKTSKKVELSAGDDTLVRLGGEQAPDDLSDLKNREEQLNIVIGYLELLEEDCNRLLNMTFYEKRSHADIAGVMGYSEAFVKVKKFRCLEHLRNRVKTHPLFSRLQ